MEIEIKKLNPVDNDQFIELIQLFEIVFEMKNFKLPEKLYLKEQLAQTNFFVFVAIQNNKVVGGLTTYTLQQYYSTRPLVYIYDLAVATNLQRKGIGKKLITSLNAYCKNIGVEEVFVQADKEDDYAIDFYKSTGGIEEDVVHFGYPLNS